MLLRRIFELLGLALLFFQLVEVVIEAIEAFEPEFAVVVDPVGDFFEWAGLETAGAPLGIACAGDEAGALENFEVLRDGGEGHFERLGEFGDGGLALEEAGKDGPAGGVGESGEGGGEVVGGRRHLYLTHRLNTMTERAVSRERFEREWEKGSWLQIFGKVTYVQEHKNAI